MFGCEEGRLNNYFKYYKLMKKTIIIALLTLVATICQAQRFEWAKGFEVEHEGKPIVGGITDSLGNLYILSQCDALSSWGDVDFIPSSNDLTKDLPIDVVIAKISPEGEIVWKKVIFSRPYTAGHLPQDIKKVGDSAFACLIQFEPSREYGYTYYLDTIVYGASNYSNYPINSMYYYGPGMTTYLLFDFDGNVIEQHFLNITFTDADGNDIVKYINRQVDSTPWLVGTWYEFASFDIDNDGNIYISRRSYDKYYEYSDSTHTNTARSAENGDIKGLKFWVDRRLAGEYQIEGNPKIWYPQLIKFSPHFDTLLGCRYVVQKNTDGTDYIYSNVDNKLKIDRQSNVYFMLTMQPHNEHEKDTVVIDSIADISFSHFDINKLVSFLVKYDTELNAKWVITFDDDNISPTAFSSMTTFSDFDFDYDSNLLFLYAVTGRGSYRDTVNIWSTLTYDGIPLNLKSNTFFCAFNNNDTNPTLHSYNRVPEMYLSSTRVFGKCGNNRVIVQNPYGGGITFPSQSVNLSSMYDHGFAMTMFDYSGRVIGGVDYGIETRTGNYAGPIIQHDSILYLCNMLRSDARFGDIDFTVLGYTNCIAKYVDTALMHPYVWSPIGIGNTQAEQPRVYPVPATDMLHFVLPNGTATKAMAISVLGNKTPLPTTGNSADISSLAPGVYILEISTGKVKYYSKFVKQ